MDCHELNPPPLSLNSLPPISPKPTHLHLPPLCTSGWGTDDNETFTPIKCLLGPAPKEVLELVKCACKAGCKEGKCSCVKNGLNCTPLCKCYTNRCNYFSSKYDISNGDDKEDSEDKEDLLFNKLAQLSDGEKPLK